MKKPWIILLLSLIPGLGLLLLGETRKAIVAVVLLALSIAGGLYAPWDSISITAFTFALIVWLVQGEYAFILARREAREDAGQGLPVRQVTIPALPPDASPGEKAMHKARHTVTEYLQPGEYARIALDGTTGTVSTSSALITVALGGTPAAAQVRRVLIGATDHDFILIRTDPFGKPCELQRMPLSQVHLIKMSEGLLADDIELEIPGSGLLSVGANRSQRAGMQQLAGILSGDGTPGAITAPAPSQADPWQADRGFSAAANPTLASVTPVRGTTSKHPLVLAALLGAAGGIAGALAAGAIATLASVALSEIIASSTDSAEVMGYMVGFYCVIMFPIGGAILGAIPGTAAGMLRISRDEPLSPLPIGLAGFLTVLVLSLGAFAALLMAV